MIPKIPAFLLLRGLGHWFWTGGRASAWEDTSLLRAFCWLGIALYQLYFEHFDSLLSHFLPYVLSFAEKQMNTLWAC